MQIDRQHSTDKDLALGTDKVLYRGVHYVVMFDNKRTDIGEYKKYKGLKCEIQITSLISHTWSEITHEKGYKFDGNLPVEIERRKNLLAGMLELADMEMDSYVDSFDKYVDGLEEEMEKGCLNSMINSASPVQYLSWKFPFLNEFIFRDIDAILNELRLFGVDTIHELDLMVKDSFIQDINGIV